MPSEQRTASAGSSRGPRTTENLTPAQRSLVQLMRDRQFGRIENLPVKSGQPVLRDALLVQVQRLDGGRPRAGPPAEEHYQLKQEVCAMFEEFARLQNCLVVRLGFRHGLPVQLETAPLDPSGSESTGMTPRLLPIGPRGSRKRSSSPES